MLKLYESFEFVLLYEVLERMEWSRINCPGVGELLELRKGFCNTDLSELAAKGLY